MLEPELEKIADKLTGIGKLVVFEADSVLNGLETFNDKETFNKVVTQISIKLNNELVLMKNKLIPFMSEVARQCEEKIQKMEDTTEISKYRIVTVDVPDLIKELKSLGTISDKRDPVKLGTKAISISLPPVEELRNYFIPKNADILHFVETLLVGKSDEDLIRIWEIYLSNVSDSNINYTQLFRNPVSHIDDILLLYSVVQNIKDEKPRGCNEREDVYLTAIQIYSKELTNLLSIIHDNIVNDRKIGRLVLSIKDDYIINVDKELYDKFLEEGGTPETLLGFCLEKNTDLNNCFLNVIKGKQTEYVTKWNNKVKLDGFNSITVTVNRYKALYNIVLKLIYSAYIPADLEEFLCCDYYAANERLNKMLTELQNDKLLDHNYVSRLIVGEIMFSNTNFTRFAEVMLSYMDINKTFTQKDAATFASFELIVEYLISQVTLEYLQKDNTTKKEYNFTWPL